MKNGKTLLTRIGTLLLVVCMLLSTLGMTTAESKAAQPQTITAFELLDQAVVKQSVPLGMAQEDLNLPDKLKATVDSVVAEVSVKAWKAQTDTPAYDPDTAETYIFTPDLEAGYMLADGVKLPAVEITVENAASTSYHDGNGGPATTEPMTETPALNASPSPMIGEATPTPADAAQSNSIGGTVWVDANEDGIKDSVESGLSGFTVSLYAAGDLKSAVATAMTGVDGTYAFADITPGSYVLGIKAQEIGGTEYLLPMTGYAGNNQFKIADDWVNAYTKAIEVEADSVITDKNAGVRTPPAIQTLAAPDYAINGVPHAWTDSATVTLSADNDELIILADSGPASTVQIHVSASDGKTVTITGRDGITYDNLYITVTNNNITLNIEDLSIIAPATAAATGTAAVLFPSGSATINVTGDCELQGGTSSSPSGTAGAGLSGGYNYPEIMIAGNGMLTVRGADGYYGGGGILNVRNLTVNAKLTVYAGATSANMGGIAGITALNNLTVNKELYVVGGSTAATTNAMGASGLSVTGTLVMNAKITAIGGDGPIGGTGFLWGGTTGGNLEINAPMVATGGKGTFTAGGIGLNPSRNKLIVNSDLSAAGGDGVTAGGYGIYAGYNVGSLRSDVVINDGTVAVHGGKAASGNGSHGLFLNNCDLTIEDGDICTYGGDGTASGGFGICANGTGNIYIEDGTLNAAGGKSTAANGNGGIGIFSSSELIIEDGNITANSGESNYNCDSAISAKSIQIKGGNVTASGILQVPGGITGFSGGTAIRATSDITITGGVVTATGGETKDPDNPIYGTCGIYTSTGDIAISNATVRAAGNGGGIVGFGSGIRAAGKITIENNADVTATGGDAEGIEPANTAGIAGGCGLFAYKEIIISDADVSAIGGKGIANNANGGRAISTENEPGGYISISGGTVTALGGDGVQHGGHGIFSYFIGGSIDIKNGANVTSIGGNTTGTAAGNMGGVGIRAFGVEAETGINYGETVTITNNAGDVYIRGGMGSSTNGARPSIMAQDVCIATGNVGVIVKEGNAPALTVKNIADGDDVYMLTVNTDPAAAVTITANAATLAPGLSPSYIYKAPAQNDGVAYMWLPAGNQTASASGYVDGSVDVTTDSLAAVTLTTFINASINPTTAAFDKYSSAADYADVSTTLTPGSYTLNSILHGGSAVAADNYTVSDNIYTFKKEYLATLGTGEQVFTFNMSGGTDPTFTVTVSDSTPQVIPVTGVTLDSTALTLTVNDTHTLIAMVSPDNATDPAVMWSSSDPSVTTVDQNGKTTAVSPGTATITVTTVDGGFTANCEVTVNELVYIFINGGFPVVTDNTVNVKGTINASFELFGNGSVLVNGKQLSLPSQGEVSSGSTIVTLKPALLQTLKNGSYPVEVRFANGGVAQTTLVVDMQPTPAVQYTIKASAEKHGSISPSGEVKVSEGISFTFYITPEDGYVIDKLTVDGNKATVKNNTYTFKNVQADHTIHVTFKKAPGQPKKGDKGTAAKYITAPAKTPGQPKTGDNSNMMGWWIALLASGLGMLCVLVWRKWRQLKGTR